MALSNNSRVRKRQLLKVRKYFQQIARAILIGNASKGFISDKLNKINLVLEANVAFANSGTTSKFQEYSNYNRLLSAERSFSKDDADLQVFLNKYGRVDLATELQYLDVQFDFIATQIQTKNSNLLRIDSELEKIAELLEKIRKRLPGVNAQAMLVKQDGIYQQIAANVFIHDEQRCKLNQYISHYNILKKSQKQQDNKQFLNDYDHANIPGDTNDFWQAVQASIDKVLIDNANNQSIRALARVFARAVDKKYKRLSIKDVAIDGVSYTMGTIASLFFKKLAREGAHLLIGSELIEFISDGFISKESMAEWSSFGLNSFLNGFFLALFVRDCEGGIEYLSAYARGEKDLDLELLKNLDPSTKKKFLRGFTVALEMIFSGSLSSLSVVPFCIVDYETSSELWRLISVALAYEGLHWSGSREVFRLLTLVIASPNEVMIPMPLGIPNAHWNGLLPAVYRFVKYTPDDWRRRKLQHQGQRIKQALQHSLDSGFEKLLNQRFNLDPKVLKQVTSQAQQIRIINEQKAILQQVLSALEKTVNKFSKKFNAEDVKQIYNLVNAYWVKLMAPPGEDEEQAQLSTVEFIARCKQVQVFINDINKRIKEANDVIWVLTKLNQLNTDYKLDAVLTIDINVRDTFLYQKRQALTQQALKQSLLLLLIVCKFADKPEEFFWLVKMFGLVFQGCLEYATLQSLYGYTVNSVETIAKWFGIKANLIKWPAASVFIIAFITLYLKITWDSAEDIYYSTLARPLNYIAANIWCLVDAEGSKHLFSSLLDMGSALYTVEPLTFVEASWDVIKDSIGILWHVVKNLPYSVKGLTWDAGKEIIHYIVDFAIYIKASFTVSELQDSLTNPEFSKSFLAKLFDRTIDFLEHHTYVLKGPLIPLLIIVAAYSSAPTLLLNKEYLDDGTYVRSYPNTIFGTIIANSFAVPKVLSMLWERIARAGATTDARKQRIILKEAKDALHDVLDQIDGNRLTEALNQWIENIENPQHQEQLLRTLFTGYEPEAIFDTSDTKEKPQFSDSIRNAYQGAAKLGIFHNECKPKQAEPKPNCLSRITGCLASVCFIG